VERVAVRELNQDTAGVLARVQRGEALEITSNGRPIARLLPIAPHPLAGLVDAGLVRPARRTLDLEVAAADVAAASGDPFAAGLSMEIQRDREDRL
jgi:prevent-host-death family protein